MFFLGWKGEEFYPCLVIRNWTPGFPNCGEKEEGTTLLEPDRPEKAESQYCDFINRGDQGEENLDIRAIFDSVRTPYTD